MSKQPLGRGLSALIPEAIKKATERVMSIPIDQISPSIYQPRINIDPQALEELASSIKEKGVIQPIIVRSLGTDRYELIAGERRLRACKMAGLTEVPAIIKEVNDVDAMEIAITENIQREDLNPIELARAYLALMDQFKLTQEELSQAVGKSRPAVANTLRLLQLPVEIQEHLLTGKISMGHARALLPLENENLQTSVCKQIIELELSVRQTEKLVQRLLNKPKTRKETMVHSPEIESIEKRLRNILATKVKIRQKGEKGKIEIEYYSTEDLERITSILEAGSSTKS